MNRAERRNFNKKNKTNYTKDEFDVLVALNHLRSGSFTEDDLNKTRNLIHLDNEELFPNGTEVKLNYRAIMARPQKDLTEEFKNWVEDNKEKEFHLSREDSQYSLVSLAEDERYTELDGKQVKKPKWLFDLYCDLYVKHEGEWKEPWTVDANTDDYVEIKKVETEKNETKQEETKEE